MSKAIIIICGRCWEVRIHGKWTIITDEHRQGLLKRLGEWEPWVTLCDFCAHGQTREQIEAFEKSVPVLGGELCSLQS